MSKPKKEIFHTQAGLFFFLHNAHFSRNSQRSHTMLQLLVFSGEWPGLWSLVGSLVVVFRFPIPPSFLSDCTAPEEMATHSSILSCRVPWTEELGGVLSMEVTKGQTWLQWLGMLSRWNIYKKRVGSYRNFQMPLPLSWQISATSALPSFLEAQRENQPHRPNCPSRFQPEGNTELASPQNLTAYESAETTLCQQRSV